jgi:hypothetical protein
VKVHIPVRFGTLGQYMMKKAHCRSPVWYSKPGLTFLTNKANFLVNLYRTKVTFAVTHVKV